MKGLIRKALIVAMCTGLVFSANVALAQVNIDFMMLDLEPNRQKAFGRIIKMFEKENPDIKVKAIYAGWDRGHEKLLIRIAANNAPEVAQHNDDFIGDYYARGILRPLEDYGCNLAWDSLFPGQERVTVYEGKHYDVAVANKGRVVFYNIDKFKEAGLEELPRRWPSKSWTWETYVDYCKRLTTDKTWGASQMYDQVPYDWISSAAPEKYGELSGLIVEGTFRWHEKWATDALQWFADLSLVEGIVPPFDFDVETNAETLWLTGKVVMLRSGSWFLGLLKEDPPDFKWNVGPFPLKNRADGMTSMVNFALPTGSAHPEAGGKFLKFVMRPKSQKILVEEIGFQPADVFTAISPVWTEQEGIPDNVDLTMFVKSLFHNRFDLFHEAGWYEGKKILSRAIEPVWTGKVTAEEQMKKIKPEMDNAFRKVREKYGK